MNKKIIKKRVKLEVTEVEGHWCVGRGIGEEAWRWSERKADEKWIRLELGVFDEMKC